ncbi:MAG TPA: ferrous iron transport protein A [Firmicutes bacterium]|jgi:ferrous iron transport protein A|nr:ferrous iron transport protein A [Bacillota bacterium]
MPSTGPTISLADLSIGQEGIVREVKTTSRMRRRLLDLGLVTNTVVEALCQSPTGDPTAYQIRGTVIALRAEEAASIIIERTRG